MTNVPEKPRTVKPNPEAIPQELKVRPQWVAWKWVWDPGRNDWTKPPYDPKTGRLANPSDPATWSDFEAAWRAYETGNFGGIGFVLTSEDPYAMVDFDDCRDPATGEIAPRVLEWLRWLASYAEVSPSGTGAKVILKAKLPAGRRREGNVEMYDCLRYTTVTGCVIGEYREIAERQREVEELHAEIFDPDRALIQRIATGEFGEVAARLWQGDWSDYKSQSEADLALCSHLARVAGRDLARIDRLFRKSGLMRGKWDEVHYADGRTYGEATIEKALSNGRRDQTSTTSGADLLAKAVEHAEWVYGAPEVEEVWEGLLFRGAVHLVAAPPKRAKSTFINHVVWHLSGPERVELRVGDRTITLIDGTFLGRRFRGWQRVLLVTENPPQFWRIRPVLRGVKVLSAFEVRRAGVEALADVIKSGEFDIIVVDSFDKAVPLKDENDNAEIAEKVTPLIEATRESGAALVLVHHHRKSGGTGGNEIRGGSALFGAVDEYLNLTTVPSEDRRALVCTLEPSGRLSSPVPVRFHMSLDDAWLPETEDDPLATIMAALTASEEPLTRKQLEEATGMKGRALLRRIEQLIREGRVAKIGTSRGVRYAPAARDGDLVPQVV